MLKAHREAIRSNFMLLVKETPSQEIIAILYEDNIFTASNVLELLQQPESKINFSLLFLLERRGPRAFISFVKALKRLNREDLVNSLSAFEDQFAKLKL